MFDSTQQTIKIHYTSSPVTRIIISYDRRAAHSFLSLDISDICGGEFVYPVASCGGWSVAGWTGASWEEIGMDSDSSPSTCVIDLTGAPIKSRPAKLTRSPLKHTSVPQSESEKKEGFRNPWFVTFQKNLDKPSHTPAVPHLSPSTHSSTPTQVPAQLSTQYKTLLVFCDSIWFPAQARVSRHLCIIVCLWTVAFVQIWVGLVAFAGHEDAFLSLLILCFSGNLQFSIKWIYQGTIYET